MAARLNCCGPFCGRTFANGRLGAPWPEGSEVMCGRHWRVADKALRLRYSKARRLMVKCERIGRPRVADLLRRTVWRIWDRIKAQVVERALVGGHPVETRRHRPKPLSHRRKLLP